MQFSSSAVNYSDQKTLEDTTQTLVSNIAITNDTFKECLFVFSYFSYFFYIFYVFFFLQDNFIKIGHYKYKSDVKDIIFKGLDQLVIATKHEVSHR